MKPDTEPDDLAASDAELVFDLVDGRLTGSAETRVRSMIDARTDLADLATWARNFRVSMARSASPDIPQHVVADLVRVFRAYHAAPSMADRLRSAARTVFDSFALPTVAGVRGLDTGTRQVVFEADGADLAVSLVDRPDGSATVIGSVLGAFGGAAQVQLLAYANAGAAEPTVIDDVEADDVGEFEFAPIGSGRYRFVITTSDRVFETDTFEVADRAAR